MASTGGKSPPTMIALFTAFMNVSSSLDEKLFWSIVSASGTDCPARMLAAVFLICFSNIEGGSLRAVSANAPSNVEPAFMVTDSRSRVSGSTLRTSAFLLFTSLFIIRSGNTYPISAPISAPTSHAPNRIPATRPTIARIADRAAFAP